MFPPTWACDLLEEAYHKAVENDIGIKPDLPIYLAWKTTSSEHSAGRAWNYELPFAITIWRGESYLDIKLIMLHEFAHILCPKQGHTAFFWDTAWQLFRCFDIPDEYALWREGNYRRGAIKAYHRLIENGAK